MDSENLPDETAGAPDRPIGIRRTPGPRSGHNRPEPTDARREPVGWQRDEPVAELTVPTNIYRARRPAVAVLLIIPAVIVGFLLFRGLAIAAFKAPFRIDGVIASSLALASLPLLVSGMYALITGAAHGAEQWGLRVWAKPPLAYLAVGIAFVTAAGIAIR